MEKDRSSKIIAIVALIVAVVGLSLGFAAFSQTLTITPSAEVKGDAGKFNVKFSTAEDQITTGKVQGTVTEGDANVTAPEATLEETTVKDLKATFQKTGGTATYKFYVYNAGELDAYLTAVNFSQAEPTCAATAMDGNTSDGLVQSACKNVKLTITVGGDDYTSTNATISGKQLSTGSAATVEVKIVASSDASTADGDYTVTFGNINLVYQSKDVNAG